MRIVPDGVGPNPGGPAAPPVLCDDNVCCGTAGLGAGVCMQGPLNNCAELVALGADFTPTRSKSGRLHTLGIQFCNFCKRHERGQKHNRVDTRTGTGQISTQVSQPALPAPGVPAMSWGARADLCTPCIKEEMKLYWERMGIAMPGTIPGTPDPATRPTLNWAEHWPTAGAPLQDLCICHERTVTQFQRSCCHACRDRAFYSEYLSEAKETEDILRERKKAVIKGDSLCDINGGTSTFYVSAAEIAARVTKGVGRVCPCGREPAPLAPAAHFIDVCLACSGVRVDPTRIPPAYQQLTMSPPNKRVTRNHPTKGPRKAKRGPEYRVNIELAWRSVDPGDEDPWIADR